MYDARGNLEGIGTYRAGDAPPSPIRVATDVIDKYVVNVEKTVQLTDDSLELQPGEVRVITCYHDDQTTYTSGIAWHTLGGEQYRLLFPDDGGLDATGRMLDLDCDLHPVTPESSGRDCDDTRSAYNRGVTETCDGEDTNCDGAQTIVTGECAGTNTDCEDPFATNGAGGIELCNDSTGAPPVCLTSATCGCVSGQGCRVCLVPFEHSVANTAGMVHPCQPALGVLRTYVCSELKKCDVEVVTVRNGWKVKISASSAGSFGSRAYDVGENLAIKLERVDGIDDEIMATGSMPVGDVYLAFTTDTSTVYTAVELKTEESSSEACPIAPATAMLNCY
jgi:hypothetical protein